MRDYKKIITALCALTIIITATGCSKSDDKNSSSNNDKTSSSAAESNADSKADDSNKNDNSSEESKDDSSNTDDNSDDESSKAEKSNIGEHLQSVADIYDEGNYTLKTTLTSTEFEGKVKLIRVVKGDDIYQLQEENMGTHGSITLDGKSYDFDNVCGMFRETDGDSTVNLIQEVINLNLEQTNLNDVENSSKKSDDDKDYDIEQYTYTGDTYITVLDFFFDKEDGQLVKYNANYTVEGQDNIVETRVVDSLTNDIDESVFNTDFTNTLADFNSMTEDQRLGFCQGLTGSYNITTDDMDEMGITTDDFKKISYDNIFRLVYNYGTGHM